MIKNPKAFCCWSGGKESLLSLYRAKKSGIHISCLVNMISEDGKYSRSHGISSRLLRLQAEAIETPLVQKRTTWKTYEEKFKKAVSDFKKEGIQAGVFGDIDLQEHRDWVERVCKEIGIQPILPLWKRKRENLLEEFIRVGFKAIVVATNAQFLGEEWLGREINNRFIEDLKTLGNIDLCGEKGEFHTFVYDGPIFKKPVEFTTGERILRDGHWFLRFLLKSVFIGMLVFARSSAFVYAQENPSQRIISLGPAITEELYILGADDKLIGCTVYCQRPPEAKNKAKVGTAIEVNLEKVVALKPDVVLSTSLTSPQAKEKLKNLGIKVVDFPAAKNFSEICRQFIALGIIVGKEKEANGVVNIAGAKVDSIRKKAEVLPKPRVFVQIGARPLVTVTADSFVNDFIEFAGGVNIARGAKSIRYSRESVIKDNPDVIIIVTMGIGAEKEKEIWQRYKSLKAAREDRIYIVAPGLLCSPTPVSFAETLEKISQILHSENEQKNN